MSPSRHRTSVRSKRQDRSLSSLRDIRDSETAQIEVAGEPASAQGHLVRLRHSGEHPGARFGILLHLPWNISLSVIPSGIHRTSRKGGHQTIIPLLRLDRALGNVKQGLVQVIRATLLPVTARVIFLVPVGHSRCGPIMSSAPYSSVSLTCILNPCKHEDNTSSG